MRAVRIAAAILLLLGVAALGAFLWYRKASQPVHEGTLVASGLENSVTIARDAVAVPYIDAASEADALYALGFVHAQDRLWQLDFNRRIAQGRVAEIAGPAAVETDRFLRTLGVYRTAQTMADRLDPATRHLLEAYAAGVNAYLAQRNGPLPPEFLLTRAPPPQKWHVADTLAWSVMMALDLSRTYRDELVRLRLAAGLSLAEIDDIRPPYPGDAPLVTADYPKIYRALGVYAARPGARSAVDATRRHASGEATGPLAESLRALAALDDAEGIGSNNWVLAGTRTASGKPLLANDPHLGFTTPPVWYYARLRAPGIEVFGATLPGVPYVLLGRNRNVAWGMTNTEADLQDLYLERINPADAAEYQTPDGYARFETRTERIDVRGAAPLDITIRSTRHGPVISDALATATKALDKDRFVLALRWAVLDADDTTIAAVRAMNRAADAKALTAAVAGFGLATQNVVYADVNGQVGFTVAGRVPLRRADNDLKGLVPAPGWDAKYDWVGSVPFTDLPRIDSPPKGMIATANSKITPPGYANHIAADWALPYRTDRITQLIEARPKHDVASLRAIQADVTSLAARDLMQALLGLKPEPGTNAGKVALARLAGWDASMRAESPEPLLFHAWLRHLRARIFNDDLESIAPDLPQQTEMTNALLRVLRGVARSRDWCDDRTTTERRESCADLAGEALDAATAELAQQSGRDVLGLKWGDAHRAVLEHRPMSNVPALRDWFELTAPAPGDTYTVNVGQLGLRAGDDWRAPYATRHGPTLRAIYDLSPGATGEWMLSAGQSGHPFADDYGSLLPSWRAVQYRPITWDRPKNDPQPHKTLVLRPAPR